MGVVFSLDPRILLEMWRMMARLDVPSPESALPHPLTDLAQRQVVGPVVQDNRQFYSKLGAKTQVGAGVATSAFQNIVMIPAGVADMAGAVLTERPDTSIRGLFPDTVNMIFSLETRTARMTFQGLPGASIFDRAMAGADWATQVYLAAESLSGIGRAAVDLGPRVSAAVKSVATTLKTHLPPTPAAALVDGGLMMAVDGDPEIVPAPAGDLSASGGKIVEAEIDKGAAARKEALDADLQIPLPDMRANALTGDLELLAQAGDWDDFVYAAGHAFDAAAEVSDKKAALQLRQSLAAEIVDQLPDDVRRMPSVKVRGQLKALIERELPAAGRNAQLYRAFQAVQDKLAGWERVVREATPDTPLPSTLRVIRQGSDHPIVAWFKKIPPVAWVAGFFATYFKPTADAPQLPAPADFSAIGPCRDGFAYIPAGSFVMGSKSGKADEQPVHKVELDAYCIARTETTNQAYWDVTGKSPSPANFDAPQQPVVNVNWQKAQDYCQAIGGSLPTEAQWEKAAKGPEGHSYGTHSGTLNKKEANYASNGTVAVGSYLPNGYGLYDMTGNVWEWTLDWYLADAYASHTSKNPTGPESGTFKVLRGGSWYIFSADRLRVADRDNGNPYGGSLSVGFRCVAPEDSKK